MALGQDFWGVKLLYRKVFVSFEVDKVQGMGWRV